MATKLALVLFVTPDCPTCPTYKPQVQRVAQDARVPLTILDAAAAQNARLVGELDLQSVPTVVLFSGGQPVDMVIGPRASAVQRMIEAAA